VNKYFHGTNYKNAMVILEHGFTNEFKNWDESEDNVVYLWDVNEHRDVEKCMKEAYHSACLSSAIKNSQCRHTVILELHGDIPVKEDTSCFVPEWEKRVCVPTDILNKAIKEQLVTIAHIHYQGYKPELRAFYLYPIYHNCGGARWESIRNHIIDPKPLIRNLKLLEKIVPYEYYFHRLYDDYKK